MIKTYLGGLIEIVDNNEEEEETNQEEEQEDNLYECNECEEDKDKEEIIRFKNNEIDICKECIEKEYPRETKEKIIEKPIEKIVYVQEDKTTKKGIILGDIL